MPILYYFISWIAVTFIQVVIVIALRYGRRTAVWLGFGYAVSIDLLDPQKLGWMTLLIAFTAYGVGLIRDTIYIENPWFEATMIVVATFSYQLAYRFFPEPRFFLDNFPSMLAISFSVAIYTVAVAGLMIWILRQRFNFRDVL